MPHLKTFLLVALAVLVTAQPVLHHHSLISETVASPCSVCAFGADQAVHAPAIAEPLVVAFHFAAVSEPTLLPDTPRTFSSRAPPSV